MNERTLTQLLDETIKRSKVYSLLSQAFSQEVTWEFLDSIATSDLSLPGDGDYIVSIRQLQEVIKQLKAERNLDALVVEFASLLLGFGLRTTYPYESIYTSKEKLVMQEARDNVVDFYSQFGLTRTDKFNEPEDHAALELEFMSFLSWRTGEALKNRNPHNALEALEAQAAFLKEHILKWMPQFLGDVANRTQHDFYKVISNLNLAVIRLDEAAIPRAIAIISNQSLHPKTNISMEHNEN